MGRQRRRRPPRGPADGGQDRPANPFPAVALLALVSVAALVVWDGSGSGPAWAVAGPVAPAGSGPEPANSPGSALAASTPSPKASSKPTKSPPPPPSEPVSDRAAAVTAADFPAPSGLRVVSSTKDSIRLTWTYAASTPATEMVRLAGFRIYYLHHRNYEDVKTVGTDETADLSSYLGGGAVGKGDNDDPREAHVYELTGLESYTIYEVWVRAIVNGTETAESPHIKANTDVDQPSEPRVTNATCYTTGSVYVEWRRPQQFDGEVDSYMLYYKKAGDMVFESIHIEAGDSEVQKFLINNLTGGHRYVLKVCAGTRSLSPPNLPRWGEASAEREVYLPESDCVGAMPMSGGDEVSVGAVAGAVGVVIALMLACVGYVIWRSYCKSAYYSIDDLPRAAAGPPAGAPDWEDAPGPATTVTNVSTSVVVGGGDGVSSSGAAPPAAVTTTTVTTVASASSGSGSQPVEKLSEHLSRLHADSDIGFAREYEEIQKVFSKGGHATHEHCSHPDNKCKNRYLNIVAYDHSRVALAQLPGQKKTSDYINANYIDGFQQFHAYIGTQGPLEDTCEAFWRMVWEQNVYVIVMITNLVERGRRKCDMYWPKDDSNPVTYGAIEVNLEKEQILANYTVRTMKIKHLKLKKKKGLGGGNEREVIQFHYTSWPDHGVPAHPLPVLSFIRKSSHLGLGHSPSASNNSCNGAASGTTAMAATNSSNPAAEEGKQPRGPVIVHCSAGVGRTGTYIAIDAVLRQIQATGRFNVFGLLRHMRKQRNHLVQTEEQYVFIHDALLEAVRSGHTEIPSADIAGEIARLGRKAENGDGQDDFETPLDKQFKLLTELAPSEFHYMSAKKSYNEPKNRDPNLLPVEGYRVALSPRPCVEGSDYINATWLHGHRDLREFVVTQHPTADTAGEFWRMLWDHNAQTVVLLTPVGSATGEFAPFWPETNDDESHDQDTFRVRFTERAVHAGHSTLDFVLSSSQDDYELTVRIIHCPEWPQVMAVAHQNGRSSSCSAPASNGGSCNNVAVAASSPTATSVNAAAAAALAAKVFDVLKLVQDWHLEYQKGPLVVVDSCGGTESATFCALTTLRNQLETDNAIDVYQVAKLYHDRRPGIWKSKDDILFLYKALEALVSSDHAVNPVLHPSSSSSVTPASASAMPTAQGQVTAASPAADATSIPPTSPTNAASAAARATSPCSVKEENETVAARAVTTSNGSLPPPLVPDRPRSSASETKTPTAAAEEEEEEESDEKEEQQNGVLMVSPPPYENGNDGKDDDEDDDEERNSETAALTSC